MSATAELLMFRVANRLYGAPVAEVRRVGDARWEAEDSVLARSALGEPSGGARGIVVDCGEAGERTLLVDAVVGVRRVPEADLRPVPAFAAACLPRGALAGFVLLDGEPTALIDLRTLVASP